MRECERCFTQLEPGVNCGEDQSVCDLCWDDWHQKIEEDPTDWTDWADWLGFSNHSE